MQSKQLSHCVIILVLKPYFKAEIDGNYLKGLLWAQVVKEPLIEVCARRRKEGKRDGLVRRNCAKQ